MSSSNSAKIILPKTLSLKVSGCNEVLKLTDSDKQIFVKHLLAPSLLNECLVKALKCYQEKVIT